MIDKEKFLTSYNIEPEELKTVGLVWEELAAIYDDYLFVEGKLRSVGKDFAYDYLYGIERADIHSYWYRTKGPGHLIEKIIRKRSEHSERFEDISRSNYHKYITDPTGIRVFLLYRGDWTHFHRYITGVLENNPALYVVDRIEGFDEDSRHYYTAGRPKIYCRNEDTRIYDENLIEIKSNGVYRSLHYIIKYKGYYVEIQRRTLFEESQSEINHDIVYPYFQNGETLENSSIPLNRPLGMVGEMNSYFCRVKGVKEEWEGKLERHDNEG